MEHNVNALGRLGVGGVAVCVDNRWVGNSRPYWKGGGAPGLLLQCIIFRFNKGIRFRC